MKPGSLGPRTLAVLEKVARDKQVPRNDLYRLLAPMSGDKGSIKNLINELLHKKGVIAHVIVLTPKGEALLKRQTGEQK